jgi:hypothetical protein
MQLATIDSDRGADFFHKAFRAEGEGTEVELWEPETVEDVWGLIYDPARPLNQNQLTYPLGLFKLNPAGAVIPNVPGIEISLFEQETAAAASGTVPFGYYGSAVGVGGPFITGATHSISGQSWNLLDVGTSGYNRSAIASVSASLYDFGSHSPTYQHRLATNNAFLGAERTVASGAWASAGHGPNLLINSAILGAGNIFDLPENITLVPHHGALGFDFFLPAGLLLAGSIAGAGAAINQTAGSLVTGGEGTTVGQTALGPEAVAPSDETVTLRIETAYRLATIEEDAREIAKAAVADAKGFSVRHRFASDPIILVSDDGVLTLQWRRENRGVMVIFTGDHTATYSVKEPGGYYASNGQEFDLAGALPVDLRRAIDSLVAV